MLVVEYLLQTQEVAQAVVEGTPHGCRLHVRPSVADGTEESPSLVRKSCSVGVHATQGVVAVGTGERYLMPCGQHTGAEVVVAATAQVRDAEGIVLERTGRILITCGVVHTTDGGEVETSVLDVVNHYAIHKDIVVA